MNIEYELETESLELINLVISIPLPYVSLHYMRSVHSLIVCGVGREASLVFLRSQATGSLTLRLTRFSGPSHACHIMMIPELAVLNSQSAAKIHLASSLSK